MHLVVAVLTLLVTTAIAADLPVVPADPIAKKKGLLFSDDFEAAEPGIDLIGVRHVAVATNRETTVGVLELE